MDPLRLLCEHQGFFTRGEAKSAGYDDRAIAAMIRAKLWQRVRRGYYTFTDLWRPMHGPERHLVRSACVLRSLGPAVALSHQSGALVHGLTVWGFPLDRVHVTRLDGGAGRVEGDVVHHEGFCLADDVIEVDGHRVLVADRCVVEAGSRSTNEVALSLFDNLLHQGLADHNMLMDRFRLMERWPRVRHLHIPIRMADGRSETPGESRGRWLCWTFGIPAPQPQFEVYDRDGVLQGTCDWGWPDHGTLGEFDGRLKYGRLLKPGQEPGEVVFAEKVREDLLREITGFNMVRLIWSDYERPRVTAARIQQRLLKLG
jgi:Transcriptional regulator, AbiEi antitoxin